jgi:hypothetical protein
MPSRTGILIVTALVVGITAGALYLAGRTRGREAQSGNPPKAGGSKPEVLPGVQVHGAELEERGADGKLRWKVTAGGDLQFDKNRGLVIGKSVKFVALQQGQVPVTVTAQHFTADYQGRKLVFEQGVQGRLAGDAGRFTAKQMEYQMATGKLIGADAILLKGGFEATAPRLVVDTRGRKVRLEGGPRFVRRG